MNPGNYVDVIITLAANEGQEAGVLSSAQDCSRSIAIGYGDAAGRWRGGVSKLSGNTVALTPEQAERLTHAMNQGRRCRSGSSMSLRWRPRFDSSPWGEEKRDGADVRRVEEASGDRTGRTCHHQGFEFYAAVMLAGTMSCGGNDATGPFHE